MKKKQTYSLNITDNKGKEYTCTLKKPDFDITAQAVAKQQSMGFLYAGRFILENCWQEGDDEIFNDVDLLSTASTEAMSVINIYNSELKKK